MAITIALSGCSDFRRAIGTEKSSPDEFEVVVRPPWSLPPGFNDSPEEIIEQEKRGVGSNSAANASQVLSVDSDAPSGFDQLFDFSEVPDNIRSKVDAETYGIQLEKRLPIQELFGGLPNIGPVLDKMGEDSRLRKARQEGRLPTDEATLATDPTNDEPLAIK